MTLGQPWPPERNPESGVGHGSSRPLHQRERAIDRLTTSCTAVALVGSHGQDGGRATIHIDGRLVGEVDAYIGDRTPDHALWYTTGQTPGTHVLKVVTTRQADTRSTGRAVAISRVITFQ